jgi:hypothetical protein
MDIITTIVIAAAAVALALLLAWVPLRVLVGFMARQVRTFIQRQRDRRTTPRETPDRRRSPVDEGVAAAGASDKPL